MYRVPRSATVRPMATPIPSSRSPCPNRRVTIDAGCAPMARRIPISGVRWVATCAITSIETKHREYQRDGAKEADECGHHPLPAQRSIQNIAEQLRTLDGKLAVDLPHGVANRRHERHGIARRRARATRRPTHSSAPAADSRLAASRAPEWWCRPYRERRRRRPAAALLSSRNVLPIGSSCGQSRSASDLVTMVTRGVLGPSDALKGRPRRIGMFIVSK